MTKCQVASTVRHALQVKRASRARQFELMQLEFPLGKATIRLGHGDCAADVLGVECLSMAGARP
jgi:hypothetical protein